MNEVVEAKHLGGYIVRVVMDDGLSADVDLSEYPCKGPIFAPLADVDFFSRVFIEGGTLVWPNGADISPERVYELVEQAQKDTQAAV